LDLSKAISRKRCKIGSKLVLITNRKSHMSFRLVPKSLTLSCGLVWAESIMCYMGGPDDPHGKGQFWWIGAPIVKYRHVLP